MNCTPNQRSITQHQQQEIWRLWSLGDSLSDIGRATGKHAASIFTFLEKTGGFKPVPRKRSQLALNLAEREEISRGIAANLSIRSIAFSLGRAASTVSREIIRNGGLQNYRAVTADANALLKALRPKVPVLVSNQPLRDLVTEKLISHWSPEQISGWLRRQFLNQPDSQVSHETIYRTLYIQSRGALSKSLQRHLRTKRIMRQSRRNNTKGNARGGIIDAISIHDRPCEIEHRVIAGHWEGDLICGSNKSYIATLVERTSRFTMLVKLQGNDTNSVVTAITKQFLKIPVLLRKSLTWDRGMELAKHKALSSASNMDVYFCDPQSPWQRGTNENTNKLLRQFFPKKTDLSVYSQQQLEEIGLQLNCRPRKVLGFITPLEKIGCVALTS